MRYYTEHSFYGNSESHGFSNDTVVLIWDSYKSMQTFLSEYSNISARRIKRSEATLNASNYCMETNTTGAPQPFMGEFWGIDENVDTIDSRYTDPDQFDGLIGELCVCYNGDTNERFYK